MNQVFWSAIHFVAENGAVGFGRCHFGSRFSYTRMHVPGCTLYNSKEST
jgi:hypothetical protein